MAAMDQPFVGPRPLGASNPIFGRDAELRELFGLVVSNSVVIVHAPSGAGKSSLLMAGTKLDGQGGGLVARLTRRKFRCFGPMRVGHPVDEIEKYRTAPGSSSLPSNRYTISAIASLEAQHDEDEQLPFDDETRRSFAKYLAHCTSADPLESNYVLIFDQFEEILTADPNDLRERIAFFQELGGLVVDPRWHVVLAMRTDYVGALDPYAVYVPERLPCRFFLDLFTPANARAAIVGPARGTTAEIPDDVATKIIDQLRTSIGQQRGTAEKETTLGQFIEPVHLQLVCERLWKTRGSDGSIKVDASVGEVDAALGDYYDGCIEGLADLQTSELEVREWIETNLITKQGIRGQIQRGPNDVGGISNLIVGRLIDSFLLRQEERRHVNWIELSHDRLIAPIRERNLRADDTPRTGPQVADFYNRILEDAAQHADLQVRMLRTWVANNLIADGQRASVPRGKKSTNGLGNEVVDQLVNAKLLRQRESGRDVLISLGRAEWVDAISKRNLRAARAFRATLILAAIAILLVGGLSTLLFIRVRTLQSERDTKEQKSVDVAKTSALRQASTELTSGHPLTALAWLEEADGSEEGANAIAAMSHELQRNLWLKIERSGGPAVAQLEFGKEQPQWLDVNDVADSAMSWQDDDGVSTLSRGVLTVHGEVRNRPGEKYDLAVRGPHGLWAVAQGGAVSTLDADVVTPYLALKTAPSGMAFSRGGSMLVTWGKDALAITAVGVSKPTWTQVESLGVIRDAAFSSDGALVIVVAKDSVAVVNAAGNVLTRRAIPGVSRMSFDPTDKHQLASITATGEVQFWEISHAAAEWKISPTTGALVMRDAGVSSGTAPSFMTWAPDGETLLAVAPGRIAVIWSTDGTPVATFQESAPITAAAFSPTATKVALGTSSGVVRTWDARYGEHYRALRLAGVEATAFGDWTNGGSSTAAFATTDVSCNTTIATLTDARRLSTYALSAPERPLASAFVAGGRLAVVCHAIRLYPFDTQTQLPDNAELAAFSRSGRVLAVAFPDSVQFYELDKDGYQLRSTVPERGATALQVLESGRALITTGDGVLTLVDVRSGAISRHETHRSNMTGALRAGDVVEILAAKRVLNAAEKWSEDELGAPQDLRWSGSGDTAAVTITGQGELRFYGVKDTKSKSIVVPNSDFVTAALSDDGTWLVTGTSDGVVQTWDTATGLQVAAAQILPGRISHIWLAHGPSPTAYAAVAAGPGRMWELVRDADPSRVHHVAACSPFIVSDGALTTRPEKVDAACSTSRSATASDVLVENRNRFFAALSALPRDRQLAAILTDDIANSSQKLGFGMSDRLAALTSLAIAPTSGNQDAKSSRIEFAYRQQRADLVSWIVPSSEKDSFAVLKRAEALVHLHRGDEARAVLAGPFENAGYVLVAKILAWADALSRSVSDPAKLGCDVQMAYVAWRKQLKVDTSLDWTWGSWADFEVQPAVILNIQKMMSFLATSKGGKLEESLVSVLCKGSPQ